MASFTDILQDAGKGFQKEIRDTLDRRGINASGRLSNSVEYEVSRKGFTFKLEVSAFSYIFSALQEGTSPEEAKKQLPAFQGKIFKWAKDKPVKFAGRTLEGTAGVIARSILQRGTLLWQNFGSKGKTTGELERIFSDEEIENIEQQLIALAEKNISEGFTKFSNQ